MANNNTKIEITKTELRALMFWAADGIELMRGGTYDIIARDYIRNNYHLMPKHIRKDYRNIQFGTRLKNK